MTRRKKLPPFPLDIEAWEHDTRRLSDHAARSYLRLLFAAWRSVDGTLPDNDVALANIAGVSPRQWRTSLRATMASFHTIIDGKWMQKRLLREHAVLHSTQSANRGSAKVRWLKSLNARYANAYLGGVRSHHADANNDSKHLKSLGCSGEIASPQKTRDPLYKKEGSLLSKKEEKNTGSSTEINFKDSSFHKLDHARAENSASLMFAMDGVAFPEWWPYEAFDGYAEMRRVSRQPLTKRGVVVLITAVTKLRADGHNPATVIDNSTLGNYRSVFAPRPTPGSQRFPTLAEVPYDEPERQPDSKANGHGGAHEPR